MDYHYISVWGIIKRFLIGWLLGFGVLVLVSCYRHWDFITTAFADNMWAVLSAVVPVLIMAGAMGYLIRALFK